ncbi:hypothetical protein E4T44_02596 [Aureobasidium sp. EXF-8845]|nr:hypothetical protein E4T45_08949 [Aureobasidium sp. EXF-8846]KAI4850695.1 hypothetical protein E4T44_02596 [Aureobasidium sp. EXF-8845]
MTLRLLILFSTLAFTSVQAWDTGVYGLGYWNETYALEANEHPNNTRSVPLQIGTQNFTFQVNVAEFTPTGIVANRTQNPRQAASFYNLIWPGGESLNETLKNAFNSETTLPLCVTVHTGTAARAITNNYREEDNGDCSRLFGKQCMDDIKSVGFSERDRCNAMWMPKSCNSKFGSGGFASTKFNSVVNNRTTDLSTMSPLEISYYESEIFSAGNTTYYEREDERLHIVFLSGNWGITPLCVRANNTKLSKNDVAVLQGGAGSVRGSIGLSVVVAVAVVMFML